MKTITSLIVALTVTSACAGDFYIIDLDSGKTTYYQPRGRFIYSTAFGWEERDEQSRRSSAALEAELDEMSARNRRWLDSLLD